MSDYESYESSKHTATRSTTLRAMPCAAAVDCRIAHVQRVE